MTLRSYSIVRGASNDRITSLVRALAVSRASVDTHRRARGAPPRARGADDLRLAALYAEYLDASTPQILGEAFFSYAERFGDDMNEALDAYLSER